MSLNRVLESPDLAQCINYLFLLEMQHTGGVHALKMTDKIARKEGPQQVFVEYRNEIADSSRDTSFLSDEDFTEIALVCGHNTIP